VLPVEEGAGEALALFVCVVGKAVVAADAAGGDVAEAAVGDDMFSKPAKGSDWLLSAWGLPFAAIPG